MRLGVCLVTEQGLISGVRARQTRLKARGLNSHIHPRGNETIGPPDYSNLTMTDQIGVRHSSRRRLRFRCQLFIALVRVKRDFIKVVRVILVNERTGDASECLLACFIHLLEGKIATHSGNE